MFGSGVTMSTQTSFAITAMGNSARAENSTLAGVRLITAMPITILTLGANPVVGAGTNSNWGGFQLSNISFIDTSQNGSALGGLLIYNTSDGIISYCDFENFNGQTADPANSTFPMVLAYGIRSNPGTNAQPNAYNNYITLNYIKGKNNAILYDGTAWNQDGPIVIGGDIFPKISPYSPFPSTVWPGTCYGIISSGPTQIYGTHFDVGGNPGMPVGCIGVQLLTTGVVRGKFESSTTPHGTGVNLLGGSTANFTGLTATRSTNTLYVSLTLGSASPYALGQMITVSGCTPNSFNGTYPATTTGTTTLSYDNPNATATMATGCAVQGVVANAADIEGVFLNESVGVNVGTNVTNNRISVSVPSVSGAMTPIDDMPANNDNNSVQSASAAAGGATNTASFSGTLIVPTASAFTASQNGQIGYDTANNIYHVGVSSGDAKVATFTTPPTSGDCVTWATASTQGDAGAPCMGIIAKTFQSGQHATISPTTLLSASTAATYLVNYYLYQDTASTGCSTFPTVKLELTWNDGFANQNQTTNMITLGASGTASLRAEFPAHVAASTAISYQTSWGAPVGCSMNGSYAFSIGAALAQP
jgi:hypothetical protein